MVRRFADSELDRVRSQHSVAEVVGRHVALRRRGRELIGLCPFHNEKTPSFTVSEDKGFYHCFGCGANGDAIGFVMAIEGCDFVEAVEILGGRREAQTLGREGRRAAPRANASPSAGGEAVRLKAREIWRAAGPAAGSPVELYLAERLGIEPGGLAAIGGVPPTLRYHPKLDYWAPPVADGGRARLLFSGPAMVAAIQGADGRLIGVHQTWLVLPAGGAWRKAAPRDPATGESLPAKKIRGAAAGGAIRLTPARRVIGSGEGIETTLAWLLDEGQGLGAGAWAGISIGNLTGPGDPDGRKMLHPTEPYDARGRPRWLYCDPAPDAEGRAMALPETCREWVLVEDHDMRDMATADAAYERGLLRAGEAGVRARAVRPPSGLDWCDYYMGKQRGAAA